jgi:cell division protein FtsL
MTARSTSALFFWLTLTIIASLMLYHTSDRVHELDQQLKNLNTQIESEQQSLHILKAEWVYLANPARVEAATRRHLELQPTATHRVIALQDIGTLLPMRDGSEPPPVQVAEAVAAPAPAVTKMTAEVSSLSPPKHKTGHIVALNSVHINDRMIMQHTASVQQSSTDSIGSLITSLSLHP